MSGRPKIYTYQSMRRLVQKLRDDFTSGGQDFILLYAYNGMGKTRLSMAFKDAGKRRRATEDPPFFHHVAMLSELQKAANSDQLYTYHFNMLRSILEKTATFFGFDDFSEGIHGVEDEVLYARQIFSLRTSGNG